MPKSPIDVVSGEIIESDWGNQIRDLTVQVMSNVADRDASYPIPVAGNAVYVANVQEFQVYDGSAWQPYLPMSGGTMTGAIYMGGNRIQNVGFPQTGDDAMPLSYAEDRYINRSGDTMEGDLGMGGNTIGAIADPTDGAHVGDRGYNDGRYIQRGIETSQRNNAALVGGPDEWQSITAITFPTDGLYLIQSTGFVALTGGAGTLARVATTVGGVETTWQDYRTPAADGVFPWALAYTYQATTGQGMILNIRRNPATAGNYYEAGISAMRVG